MRPGSGYLLTGFLLSTSPAGKHLKHKNNMPVPSADFKKAIKQLSDKEKEALLLKAVRRDAELYELLSYELLEEVSLEQLVAETSERMYDLMYNTSGRIFSKAISRSLRKCIKEIARFKRITKDVKGEVDLQLYLLRLIFDNFSGQFESQYKTFYVTTARLVVRTMQLIQKKLHPDYHLEYKEELDQMLNQLRSRSKSKSLPFTLPVAFETE